MCGINVLNFDAKEFVAALDAAQGAHLDWSRKILRAAVLRTDLCADVVQKNAHELCLFGQFLESHNIAFNALHAERSKQLSHVHKQMHDAIRNIAGPISQGLPGKEQDFDLFERTQAELLEHLAYFKTHAIHHYTQVDNLTGLPLRQRLEQDFARKRPTCQGQLALMFIDVDHFKSINDFYGHHIGDKVLQHLVVQTHNLLAPGQAMYRYGGEEFIITACNVPDANTAHAQAEFIREFLNETPIIMESGEALSISVTIGIAIAQPQEPLEKLIERADQAMYIGKKQGRNRVICAPTEESIQLLNDSKTGASKLSGSSL